MVNLEKIVIIHCHMFKNAGTTFDWSLEQNFSNNFLDHRSNDKMIHGGQEYLENFIREHDIKALSSHHIQFPLPIPKDYHILPVLLIRHPIDRVGSVYQFEKMQKAETPGAINAKKLSFEEYIYWRMDPSSGATIRNFQTAYILGRLKQPNKPIVEDDFKIVLKRIKNCSLLGLVDIYDESMILFEQTLQSHFQKIDLSYLKQNISPGRKPNMQERIDDVYNNINYNTAEILKAKNNWDLLLYKETKKIISGRIKDMKNFLLQKEMFIKRCVHQQAS